MVVPYSLMDEEERGSSFPATASGERVCAAVRLHRGTQPVPVSQVFSKEFLHAPVTGLWEPDQMRTEKPSIR